LDIRFTAMKQIDNRGRTLYRINDKNRSGSNSNSISE